jgi:hemerythrin-like domain-containing protein
MGRSHELDPASQLGDEHACLREMLDNIRSTLIARNASRSAVAAMFQQLSLVVLEHFEHEEQGGYFTEVIERAPRLSERADALLSEHPAMATQLVTLRTFAARRDEPVQWFASLSEMFERFVECFRAHETAENQLVQEAYSDDIGAED